MTEDRNLPARQSSSADESGYPLLKKALDEGRITGDTKPTKRALRCGPWVELPDGSFVCEKCGELDAPGSGRMGCDAY